MSLRSRLRSMLSPRADAAPAAVRTDTTVPTAYGSAAVVNPHSGLGSDRDSGATGRPNVHRNYLTEEELVAAIRGTLYRRICELTPRWATTRGWTLTDEGDDPKPLHKAMRRLKVTEVFRQADTWGGGLGESRVLLIVDEKGRPPLSEPLDPSKVTKVHRLEVFDRREFSPLAFEADAAAGELGMPTAYHLHPRRVSAPNIGRVHASRFLRFYGHDLPPSERGLTYAWGADAIGQTLWDGIRNMSSTSAAAARLAQELSVAVFRMAPPKGSGDERSSVLESLAALNLMKSIANAVTVGPEEDFTRVNAGTSGFSDLSEDARLQLAALTGFPLVLLFGEAPGGLNTDGDSWQENWYASIAAHQEERYREPLERLIELLYYAEQGGLPSEWDLSFRKLGELGELEKAQLRLTHTQADSTAILDGVLTPAEARQRYMQTGGWTPDLQPVQELEGKAAEEPAPRVGEISAAVEVGRAVSGRELAPEAGKAILTSQLKLAPEIAAAIASPPAAPAPGARIDATEGAVWLGAMLPADALPGWQAARAAVEAVTGPLQMEDAPHVTVLYCGQVAPAAMDDLLSSALAVTKRARPCRAEASRVRVLGDGAVVLEVSAWGLDEVHGSLLTGLAHLVSSRQFPRYIPHVTIGYSPALTPEQRAAVLQVEVPRVEWVVGAVEVRRGGERVAVLPFDGREDGARG